MVAFVLRLVLVLVVVVVLVPPSVSILEISRWRCSENGIGSGGVLEVCCREMYSENCSRNQQHHTPHWKPSNCTFISRCSISHPRMVVMSRRVRMIGCRGDDVVKFEAPNGSQQVIVFLAGLAQIRRQWKSWEKGMVEGEEQKVFMPLVLRVIAVAAGGWLAC